MSVIPLLAIGYFLTRGKASSGGKNAQAAAKAKAWPQAKKFAAATPQGRATSFAARMASKARRK